MNTQTTHPENSVHCIDICNSLLRGELSAVETYNQAIEKFSDAAACSELIRIRNEHVESVAKLQANVVSMGGEPDNDSGAWGVFSKLVQGTANLFGDESALMALKRGEEHGRDEYQKALDDVRVMPSCKELMLNDLLPKVQSHISTLDRLEESERLG